MTAAGVPIFGTEGRAVPPGPSERIASLADEGADIAPRGVAHRCPLWPMECNSPVGMKSIIEPRGSSHQQSPHNRGRIGTWTAGPPDSELTFSLRHLVLTQIRGRALRWKAMASFDFEVPSRSWVDVVVDASSLDTGDAERDEQVRSQELLDVAAFPEIHFHSREVLPASDGRRFTVRGDLTLRHLTRPITIELERTSLADAEGQPQHSIAATGRVVIDRQEFGLRWNQDVDRQGVVVGNHVDVKMRVLVRRLTAVG